jgi:hypothetical protein
MILTPSVLAANRAFDFGSPLNCRLILVGIADKQETPPVR